MILRVLAGQFAIARLDPCEPVPAWAWQGGFCSITRTERELSVVCAGEAVPVAVRAERGWRALELQGPLDLSATGILSALAAVLAAARIPLFAVSTFDTDYILVRDRDLTPALQALSAASYTILGAPAA